MEAFLDTLLHRLLPEGPTFEIHAFQGKTDLLGKLEERLRGYRRGLPDDWRLVVMVDRDNDDCHELKEQMERLAADSGLRTRSKAGGDNWQLVNRVVIEELEAWYFGDWNAVSAVYPNVSPTVPRQARYRDPDGIAGGTWEAFERVLQRKGHFKTRASSRHSVTAWLRRQSPLRRACPLHESCSNGRQMKARRRATSPATCAPTTAGTRTPSCAAASNPPATGPTTPAPTANSSPPRTAARRTSHHPPAAAPAPAGHLLHRTGDVPAPPHRTAGTPVPTSCRSILEPHSMSLIPSKACPGPRSGSRPRTRSGAGIHGPAVPTAPAFDTVARFDGRSKSLPPASTIATGSGSRSKPLSPGSAKPSQPEPALGCGSSAAIQRRAIRRGTTRSAAAARPMGDHARGPASRRCDRQSSNIATIFP